MASTTDMAATAPPSNSDFYTLIGTTGPNHIPWSLNTIQAGLRFSNDLFANLTKRCISCLKSNQLYGVNLRGKEKKPLLDKIATQLISELRLPDHVGAVSAGFVHTAVGQLLRKVNETETQRKTRDTKRERESASSDVSPIKSQKLNKDWTRTPAVSPPLPRLASPPDPQSIHFLIKDGTALFSVISIQKIMIDDSVTTRLHTQVDMGKLTSVLRKRHFWGDRDENPHTPSKIYISYHGKNMLVNDTDDLQEACKFMESEFLQQWELHVERAPHGLLN